MPGATAPGSNIWSDPESSDQPSQGVIPNQRETRKTLDQKQSLFSLHPNLDQDCIVHCFESDPHILFASGYFWEGAPQQSSGQQWDFEQQVATARPLHEHLALLPKQEEQSTSWGKERNSSSSGGSEIKGNLMWPNHTSPPPQKSQCSFTKLLRFLR